jgi:NitT/TauT family transport system ATP-binding protein
MTYPTLRPASASESPVVDSQSPAAVRSGPTPSIQVTGLTQIFERDRPPVLDRIDLAVAPGEFVCLLGASGCGKSTLLSLIAGLSTPTSGGIEVTVDRPALMFQEPALLPWLTAAGNVELALRAQGMGRRERRAEAEQLLTLVNLAGQGRKRVHELSGGMRQRVALARAVAQDSRLLLMDEPFASLDAITRDALHEELTRLWSEQELSIVFVTHNVREAVRLGQRVLLMSSRPGRIVREWQIELSQPRAIESPGVSVLATEITHHLRAEISRHAR